MITYSILILYKNSIGIWESKKQNYIKNLAVSNVPNQFGD